MQGVTNRFRQHLRACMKTRNKHFSGIRCPKMPRYLDIDAHILI